ncbi:unnamed protein product, partial [Discosporangium mesarthrocarpum]
ERGGGEQKKEHAPSGAGVPKTRPMSAAKKPSRPKVSDSVGSASSADGQQKETRESPAEVMQRTAPNFNQHPREREREENRREKGEKRRNRKGGDLTLTLR